LIELRLPTTYLTRQPAERAGFSPSHAEMLVYSNKSI